MDYHVLFMMGCHCTFIDVSGHVWRVHICNPLQCCCDWSMAGVIVGLDEGWKYSQMKDGSI